jgi:hypothetical protein
MGAAGAPPFAGSGVAKGELACSAGACGPGANEQSNDEKVSLLLGVDTLYHVLPG